jgi:hypothetical protein
MRGVFLPLIFWCLKMGENGVFGMLHLVGFHTDVKTPLQPDLHPDPILTIHYTQKPSLVGVCVKRIGKDGSSSLSSKKPDGGVSWQKMASNHHRDTWHPVQSGRRIQQLSQHSAGRGDGISVLHLVSFENPSGVDQADLGEVDQKEEPKVSAGFS